ncbi:hypothetical protein [Methanoregula sp.]|uniref:hypothetical protein n=1 Tax=Methanoregula sp. TaxID=2052170 RepID=UPI00236B3C3E|nr:hypothetical protein [Methanoregula sp.]MDD1687442.1 hypothetical protein [Methanoregula sp.]
MDSNAGKIPKITVSRILTQILRERDNRTPGLRAPADFFWKRGTLKTMITSEIMQVIAILTGSLPQSRIHEKT